MIATDNSLTLEPGALTPENAPIIELDNTGKVPNVPNVPAETAEPDTAHGDAKVPEQITRDNASRVPAPTTPGIPRWAGDVDVRLADDPDVAGYTRSTVAIGGANVLDAPGYAIDAILREYAYEKDDRNADYYAEITFNVEDHAIPVRYAYRAAAALALLARAYEKNLPEPTEQEVDGMEKAIRALSETPVPEPLEKRTPAQILRRQHIAHGALDDRDFRRQALNLLADIAETLENTTK